ncbi:MAG TPA: glycosyltransferase family 1 protein, partial [Herbaspirillum sp.]
DALALDRQQVREHALAYSWETATQQFLQHLHLARRHDAATAKARAVRPESV